jgi:hypothetical protein
MPVSPFLSYHTEPAVTANMETSTAIKNNMLKSGLIFLGFTLIMLLGLVTTGVYNYAKRHATRTPHLTCLELYMVE